MLGKASEQENVPNNTGPHAEAAKRKRGQDLDQVPDVLADLEGAAQEEAFDVAIDTGQATVGAANRGVEVAHGVSADVVAERDPRRDGVGQVKQGRSGDDRDEVGISRDGGGDDECNSPPDGHDCGVEDLASLGSHQWSVEDVDQHVVVEHLDANVSVQTRCDEAAQESEDVACEVSVVAEFVGRNLPAVCHP